MRERERKRERERERERGGEGEQVYQSGMLKYSTEEERLISILEFLLGEVSTRTSPSPDNTTYIQIASMRAGE